MERHVVGMFWCALELQPARVRWAAGAHSSPNQAALGALGARPTRIRAHRVCVGPTKPALNAKYRIRTRQTRARRAQLIPDYSK